MKSKIIKVMKDADRIYIFNNPHARLFFFFLSTRLPNFKTLFRIPQNVSESGRVRYESQNDLQSEYPLCKRSHAKQFFF